MITRRLFGALLGAAPFASLKAEAKPAASVDFGDFPGLLAKQKAINDGHVTERWVAAYRVNFDDVVMHADFKVGWMPTPTNAQPVKPEWIAQLKKEFAKPLALARQKALDNPGSQHFVAMALPGGDDHSKTSHARLAVFNGKNWEMANVGRG